MSWVDSFKLPMREIKMKYTKSEIALLAWDSRLKSYNLTVGTATPAKTEASPSTKQSKDNDLVVGTPDNIVETDNSWYLPEGVNNGVPIDKRAFDENGDIDLRRLPGREAARYIQKLGFPMIIR